MEKRLDLVFGSDSDESKILPGVQQFTKDYPEWEVRVDYASADNTPDKVLGALTSIQTDAELDELSGRKPGTVYISGAGLSNLLTGVIKIHARVNDLNIGIPISDSSSEGLTSILSTVEKPPRNAVLAVSMNNSYAALSIARSFKEGLDKVVIADPISSNRCTHNFMEEHIEKTKADTLKLQKEFEKYGISPTITKFGDLSANSVILSPFTSFEHTPLYNIDALLNAGNGVQIAVPSGDILHQDSRIYTGPMFGLTFNHTGFVSSYAAANSYINAVMVAAQLTRNSGILEKIALEKQTKADKLNAHKGLSVRNGEVTTL